MQGVGDRQRQKAGAGRAADGGRRAKAGRLHVSLEGGGNEADVISARHVPGFLAEERGGEAAAEGVGAALPAGAARAGRRSPGRADFLQGSAQNGDDAGIAGVLGRGRGDVRRAEGLALRGGGVRRFDRRREVDDARGQSGSPAGGTLRSAQRGDGRGSGGIRDSGRDSDRGADNGCRRGAGGEFHQGVDAFCEGSPGRGHGVGDPRRRCGPRGPAVHRDRAPGMDDDPCG